MGRSIVNLIPPPLCGTKNYEGISTTLNSVTPKVFTMEVISGVSSIVAIVGAVAQISKQSAALYLDLRDAPLELASLRDNLKLTQVVLDEICELRSGHFIPQSFQHKIEDSLMIIEASIGEIQRDYRKYAGKTPGKRTCIKWALSSRRLIEKNERQIQSTLSYFKIMLQLAEL